MFVHLACKCALRERYLDRACIPYRVETLRALHVLGMRQLSASLEPVSDITCRLGLFAS
jgi:hypothetical protein